MLRNLVLFLLCLIVLPAVASAEEVKLRHGDLTLNASLELADGKTPADGVILMTHGTLAHNGMEIITTLQSLFGEQGYSTLAINLGLGLDDRHGFYDCKVPHTHRYADALDEIGAWVDWLKQQGAGEIVLLGHSRGGNQSAGFAAGRDDPAIKGIILVAPLTWSPEAAAESYRKRYGRELAPVLEQARERVAAGRPDALLEHTDFLYCEDATVAAGTFVSYYGPEARLDTTRLLPEIDRPVLVFAGTEDQVVKDLASAMAPLAEAGTIRLEVIDGADHSFRDLYADELVEAAVIFLEE